MKRGVVMRGLRFGLAVGGFCALGWSTVGAACVTVAWVLGHRHGVPSTLVSGVVLVAGSLFVGAALGLLLGTALALAPDRLTSHGLLRRVLTGLVAGTLFLGEVAVSVEGGVLPVLLMLVGVPVVGAAAAACSGDIVGRSRRHAWLRPRPLPLPQAGAPELAGRGRLRAVMELLWN
ncbi:hypothetical protein [Streptomyces tropicalis]|uniref:Uncharacterized protein n=1 Tax=Streptomyces tropicalis TaxID=3034234 RepID=A0ABT5ZYQ1_9ACTN|nr:hypothetical protein [Streptomyces tropicalis]MDF3297497.1 hypothetical protein [Streptomyces tropicalis]